MTVPLLSGSHDFRPSPYCGKTLAPDGPPVPSASAGPAELSSAVRASFAVGTDLCVETRPRPSGHTVPWRRRSLFGRITRRSVTAVPGSDGGFPLRLRSCGSVHAAVSEPRQDMPGSADRGPLAWCRHDLAHSALSPYRVQPRSAVGLGSCPMRPTDRTAGQPSSSGGRRGVLSRRTPSSCSGLYTTCP